MVDRIADPWGTRTPFEAGEDWPVGVDQYLEEGVYEEEVDRWGGPDGLLRDLHDLYVTANFCDITWTMIGQAAQGAGDRELFETVNSLERQTSTQIKWLKRG